jgi:hypothetical protein
MKREAHSHTKMKRLCKLLDLPLWGAVGILESLWKLTAQEAPQGDIGKLSDEDIALGIDWKGDPGKLLVAIKESRWVDVSEKHRYVIHDWHEHSDDSLDMKLARVGKLYANDYTPRMSKLSKEERTKICAVFAWPGAGVLFCGTKRHEKALPVTSHQSPAPAPGPAPAPPAAEPPPPEPIRPNVVPFIPTPDPDAGAELPLANWLLEEIGVPADPSLIRVVGGCIRLWAKENAVTMQESSEWIHSQAVEQRCRGETINRFWFSDQRYRPVTGKTRKQADKEARRKAFIEGG